MRIRLGIPAATITACCLLTGCGGDHAARSAHVVSGSHGGLSHAELDVESGATSITVLAAPLSGELYRVSTPASAGLRPLVHLDHGQLRVSLTGHGGGPSRLTIELSQAVAWQLRFNGGASALSVDFRAGKLAGVDLVAGDARAALSLPHPSGTVRIAEQGGLSRLTVRVAGSAPVRATLSGGAAHVTLYGVTHTGVAGGSVFTSPGWSTASGRYDLLARGGVSSLAVGRL